MKLAISNIAWNDNHDFYYDLILQNGFSGLEIAPTKLSFAPYDDLKIAARIKQQLLDQYKLPIVSIQSLLFGTNGLALFQSSETRNNLKNYLKKAIVYAETINCPILVFGNPKNRVMNNPKSDYPKAIEFFQELGNFAKEHYTCLCIEPNAKEYGTNFINTLTEANQLVNTVNNAGFGMIVDTSTMLINQDSPTFALTVLENTKHIHISMPFLKPLNHEFSKYEAWITQFMMIIKNSQYDKFVSIEMTNAEQHDVMESLVLLKKLADLK